MKQEKIVVGQVIVEFLLEAADTQGTVSMFEFTVPAGAKVPIPHYHEHFDETVYGLAGTLRYTIEGKVVDLLPGESLFIRRGEVHGFNNVHQEDTRALVIITPALLGPIFFKETAEILNAGGPPDVNKLRLVMAKHGLVPVMPEMHPA